MSDNQSKNSQMQNNNNLWDSIKRLYYDLPSSVRIIIRRALASTIILTVVSQIATHWYAMRYGVRIPLEGVPFLIVMSIVASIVLTLISIITLILIPLGRNFVRNDKNDGKYFRILVPLFERMTPRFPFAEIITPRSFLFAFAILYSIFFTLTGLMGIFGFNLNPQFDENAILTKLMGGTYLVIGIFFTLVTLGRVTVETLQNVSLGIYLVTVIGLAIAMLGPLFDQILRSTRYGGGIEVQVAMHEETIERRGNLFLISSDTVTLWNPKKKRFEQINSNHIDYVAYAPSPSWKLPSSRSFYRILVGN